VSDDAGILALLPTSQRDPDVGLSAIVPGSLDEDMSEPGVAAPRGRRRPWAVGGSRSTALVGPWRQLADRYL